MAFGLTIGTERATALQNSIQDELTKRGFSADADPVMAEYITIMIINNKTPEQISSELEDLIGSDFDRSFTDWLFAEAAKGPPDSEAPVAQTPVPSTALAPAPSTFEPAAPATQSQRPPNGPRSGAPLYQQALSQISPSGHKRTASARSPSPGGFQPPNKTRRTEPPSGPRAMAQGQRSLLERMGGRTGRSGNGNGNGRMNDEIQARIDNITANSPEPGMMGGGAAGGFAGMAGMDMSAMAMSNPMVLQEMMMNQMALMAQMAGAMGILNPGVMNGGAFPGMPVGMTPEMFAQMQGMQPQMGIGNGSAQRGGRPTRGRGGKRGGDGIAAQTQSASEAATTAPAPLIAAPVPQPAVPAVPAPELTSAPIASTSASPASATPSRAGFVAPERPQSPTLCKFALKCTNPLCRYSHPSPVATAESGVVLSNEACDAGKNCKDKDCIKAHVSPAVLTAPESIKPKPHVPAPAVPCKFGLHCARINSGCPYQHPARPASDKGHFAQQCRFGAGCTRATCPFQHPEGRVLPNSFHKGLSASAPVVNVQAPETGSIGAGVNGASPHKSVTFNKGTEKEDLQRRMKELQEMKNKAEAAVRQAEAAAASKKDESKPVAVSS